MKLKLCTALLAAATLFAPLSSVAEKAQDAAAKRTAVEAYGKLPLSFEPTENPARFLARSGSYAVLVGAGQSSVAVTDAKSGQHQTLRFAFDHANPAARLEAMEPQPGVTNYYLGRDPGKWRLGVKSYARLRSAGLYPGVDVVYYGDHRRLEFDFVVAPKADPAAIALSFSGMDKFYKEAGGDLVAEVGGQPVRFAKPYAYQKVDGASRPVDADYELAADGKVHLRIGDYDRNRELIVDPVVSYATFLGGGAGDAGNGIAVDSTGAAYVTGTTYSTDFPDGATLLGSSDAFVTKYNATGTAYVYTTIIGGATPALATASGNGIALDSTNKAYITGKTNFTDLPGNVNYANGLNTYQGGDSDAFIVILNANGTLLRSSYLGGSGADAGYGIAVDSSTNVIVVGQTCAGNSINFPGYNAFETQIEPCVAFVTKMDNALHIGEEPANGASAMTPLAVTPTSFFSEFYGGQPVAPFPTTAWAALTSFPLFAIIEDNEVPPNIQIVTTSGTSGSSMGTPLPPGTPINPWNSSLNGLTRDGTVVWTNLGPAVRPPNATTQANGVALDPLGDIFVAGGTDTADLGTFTGPFGPFSHYHGTGAWVLKVSGVNGAFLYGAALEKNASDVSATIDTARAIAVDTSGRAYVTGTATGSVITTGSAYKPAIAGGEDAFLVRINTSGSAIEYGTYLGGSGNDHGLGVAVDRSGAAYVTGSTQSTNFPTINPLDDPNSTPVANAPILTLQGQQNAFISKFTADGSALIFSAYLGGSNIDQGNAIALDTGNAGDMYVAGTTFSNDFELNLDPSTYTAPQTTYGGGNGDAFVALVAGSSLPTVTITPGNLNFGAEDVGMSTAPVAVQYINTNASSTVSVSSITFGGANAGDFMQVFPGTAPGDCAPGVINASTFCNIWVVFTPSAGGRRSGTLTITDDASTKPHVVSLAGTGEVPQDAFSPTSLTFAASVPQTIGSPTSAQSVTLKDTGQGTLDISSIAITGTASADFSQTNTCQAQLASGSSCTFSVIFTPTASGVRTASLTITDNAPGSPHNITLQGTGAQVKAPTIAPLTLTFPTEPLSSTSAAMTVTVTNNDSASALALSTPVITGDFQLAAQPGSCGASLPANGSCVIGVNFIPTALGARTGTLSISSNAASSPVVVQLTGTGGAATSGSGTIQLSAASVNFGSQQVGTTSSPARSVTLTNSSTTSVLTITSIALTGNADFAISSNNCPASLAVGAACQIQLTFTPSATVLENATLTVTGSASNSPQTLAISGTGATAPPPGPTQFNMNPADSGGEAVTQGSTATFTLAVTPQNSFNGTIAFTCSGPVGSTCSVTPNPLTMDGITVPTVKLYVKTTGGNGGSAKSVSPQLVPRSIFLALLPFSMMGMLLINKRRGIWLVLGLVVLCLLFGMAGCGGSSGSSGGLAAGTYQVTLTGTASGSAPETQIVNLTLVVNKQ
jgi:Beta-propeller repeat/Abnormal spindle-like microcephaly-assoc'd, ASPM-SPD-2-Hydin